MGKKEALPTIWQVSDDLWDKIALVLSSLDPPKATGRKRVDARKQLEGIIFRMRSGCQWNHLLREFGDDSTVHRTFQRWTERGVFQRVWGVLVEECEELGGVNWEWQAADGTMGKARSGGTSSDPTPRTGASTAPSAACWSKRMGVH